MSEQEPETKVGQPIWTPPKKMDPNVGKMAWALFIECWKDALAKDVAPRDINGVGIYEECVKQAESIEAYQNPPSEHPGL